MIYYSIMLNNELEMLQLQFLINYHIVDKFIIIEANKTFSGVDKPYYFSENRKLFENYEDKIIYQKIEHPDNTEDIELKNFISAYMPYKNNWIREKNQRERFLKTMTFNDNDLIFFSDVDEIVFLDKVLDKIDFNKINYFTLIHCVFYVNTTGIPIQYIIEANCCYPYKVYKKYKDAIDTHFNIRKLNHICDDHLSIDDAGYHFSYCYDLHNKLNSFSHGEYNNSEKYKSIIDSKKSINENNVIEIPKIISDNIPRKFVYPPTMDYFKTIYHENLWKNDETISGDGSTLKCSYPYLSFLKEFVKTNNIKTILDLGCGDFNLMKHVDFKDVEYLGVDLVNELIEKNNINYGSINIKFINNKIHDYEFKDNYDLILCKDVLQHWSTQSVITFLSVIKNYKYCLLINDYNNDEYYNKNFNVPILDSEYTIVDLTADPYNVNGEYIFEWQSCNTLKKCFLIKK
jgi:hypothetical protein